MKTILIVLMTFVSFGYANAQSTAIEGNWGYHQEINGIKFDMTFSISKNSVTVTNVCTGFGTSATAQVVVTSNYTENMLFILESKQDEKSIGPLNCNVSAHQDVMNYSIQGSQLIFTHTGSPESFVLIRK